MVISKWGFFVLFVFTVFSPSDSDDLITQVLKEITQKKAETILKAQNSAREYFIHIFTLIQNRIHHLNGYNIILDNIIKGLQRRELDPLRIVKDRNFFRYDTEIPSLREIAKIIYSMQGCNEATDFSISRWEAVLETVPGLTDRLAPVVHLDVSDSEYDIIDRLDRPFVNFALLAVNFNYLNVTLPLLRDIMSGYRFDPHSADLVALVENVNDRLAASSFTSLTSETGAFRTISSEVSSATLSRILSTILSLGILEPQFTYQVNQLLSALKRREDAPDVGVSVADWLSAMRKDDFPDDIIEARNDLMVAIKSGALPGVRLNTLQEEMEGRSRTEKLLGLLAKLLVLPVDDPAAFKVHAIYPHVKLRFLADIGKYFVPESAADMAFLLNSFLTIKNQVSSGLMQQISEIFSSESLDWDEMFKSFDFSQYSRPRTLLRDILKLMLDSHKLPICHTLSIEFFLKKNADAGCSEKTMDLLQLDGPAAPVVAVSDAILKNDVTPAPVKTCPAGEPTKVVDPECLVEIIDSKQHAGFIIDLIRFNPIPAEKYPHGTRYAIFHAVLEDLKASKYKDEVSEFVISQAILRLPLNEKANSPPSYLHLCPEELKAVEERAPPVRNEDISRPSQAPPCNSIIDPDSLLEAIDVGYDVSRLRYVLHLGPIPYEEYGLLKTREEILKSVLERRKSALNRTDIVDEITRFQMNPPINAEGKSPPVIINSCPENETWTTPTPAPCPGKVEDEFRENTTSADTNTHTLDTQTLQFHTVSRPSEAEPLPGSIHLRDGPSKTETLNQSYCSPGETLTAIIDSSSLFKAINTNAPKARFIKNRVKSYIIPIVFGYNYTNAEVLRDVLDAIKEEVNNSRVMKNVEILKRYIVDEGAGGEPPGMIYACLPNSPAGNAYFNINECAEKACSPSETIASVINTDSLFDALGPQAPKNPYVMGIAATYIMPVDPTKRYKKGDVLRNVLEDALRNGKDEAAVRDTLANIMTTGSAEMSPEIVTVCFPKAYLENAAPHPLKIRDLCSLNLSDRVPADASLTRNDTFTLQIVASVANSAGEASVSLGASSATSFVQSSLRPMPAPAQAIPVSESPSPAIFHQPPFPESSSAAASTSNVFTISQHSDPINPLGWSTAYQTSPLPLIPQQVTPSGIPGMTNIQTPSDFHPVLADHPSQPQKPSPIFQPTPVAPQITQAPSSPDLTFSIPTAHQPPAPPVRPEVPLTATNASPSPSSTQTQAAILFFPTPVTDRVPSGVTTDLPQANIITQTSNPVTPVPIALQAHPAAEPFPAVSSLPVDAGTVGAVTSTLAPPPARPYPVINDESVGSAVVFASHISPSPSPPRPNSALGGALPVSTIPVASTPKSTDFPSSPPAPSPSPYEPSVPTSSLPLESSAAIVAAASTLPPPPQPYPAANDSPASIIPAESPAVIAATGSAATPYFTSAPSVAPADSSVAPVSVSIIPFPPSAQLVSGIPVNSTGATVVVSSVQPVPAAQLFQPLPIVTVPPANFASVVSSTSTLSPLLMPSLPIKEVPVQPLSNLAAPAAAAVSTSTPPPYISANYGPADYATTSVAASSPPSPPPQASASVAGVITDSATSVPVTTPHQSQTYPSISYTPPNVSVSAVPTSLLPPLPPSFAADNIPIDSAVAVAAVPTLPSTGSPYQPAAFTIHVPVSSAAQVVAATSPSPSPSPLPPQPYPVMVNFSQPSPVVNDAPLVSAVAEASPPAPLPPIINPNPAASDNLPAVVATATSTSTSPPPSPQPSSVANAVPLDASAVVVVTTSPTMPSPLPSESSTATSSFTVESSPVILTTNSTQPPTPPSHSTSEGVPADSVAAAVASDITIPPPSPSPQFSTTLVDGGLESSSEAMAYISTSPPTVAQPSLVVDTGSVDSGTVPVFTASSPAPAHPTLQSNDAETIATVYYTIPLTSTSPALPSPPPRPYPVINDEPADSAVVFASHISPSPSPSRPNPDLGGALPISTISNASTPKSTDSPSSPPSPAPSVTDSPVISAVTEVSSPASLPQSVNTNPAASGVAVNLPAVVATATSNSTSPPPLPRPSSVVNDVPSDTSTVEVAAASSPLPFGPLPHQPHSVASGVAADSPFLTPATNSTITPPSAGSAGVSAAGDSAIATADTTPVVQLPEPFPVSSGIPVNSEVASLPSTYPIPSQSQLLPPVQEASLPLTPADAAHTPKIPLPVPVSVAIAPAVRPQPQEFLPTVANGAMHSSTTSNIFQPVFLPVTAAPISPAAPQFMGSYQFQSAPAVPQAQNNQSAHPPATQTTFSTPGGAYQSLGNPSSPPPSLSESQFSGPSIPDKIFTHPESPQSGAPQSTPSNVLPNVLGDLQHHTTPAKPQFDYTTPISEGSETVSGSTDSVHADWITSETDGSDRIVTQATLPEEISEGKIMLTPTSLQGKENVTKQDIRPDIGQQTGTEEISENGTSGTLHDLQEDSNGREKLIRETTEIFYDATERPEVANIVLRERPSSQDSSFGYIIKSENSSLPGYYELLKWPILLRPEMNSSCYDRRNMLNTSQVLVINITSLFEVLETSRVSELDEYLTATYLTSLDTYYKLFDFEFSGFEYKEEFLRGVLEFLLKSEDRSAIREPLNRILSQVPRVNSSPLQLGALCNHRIFKELPKHRKYSDSLVFTYVTSKPCPSGLVFYESDISTAAEPPPRLKQHLEIFSEWASRVKVLENVDWNGIETRTDLALVLVNALATAETLAPDTRKYVENYLTAEMNCEKWKTTRPRTERGCRSNLPPY